jgi:glycosyltransferase involved in cell wall biosynthesis
MQNRMVSNTKKKVTIGICAKNAEKTIRQCLESITSQDFDHRLMDIALVDDGSEDKTLQVMKDCSSRNDIDTQIFSGSWRGIGKARNIVVQNALGDYIVWVDSDETIEKSFVKKQTLLMDKNPQAGIAVAKPLINWDDNLVLVLDQLPYVVEFSLQDWKNPMKMPGTGATIYRVEALRQIGGFNEQLSGACEDIEVANKVRKAGWSIIKGDAQYYENHGGLDCWSTLWKRSFERGINSRFFQDVTNTLFPLHRMNPLASLVDSFRYAVFGYSMTKRKIALVLPLHFTFKMTAWYRGFTKR